MKNEKDLIHNWKIDLQIIKEEKTKRKNKKKKTKRERTIKLEIEKQFLGTNVYIIKRMGSGDKQRLGGNNLNRSMVVILGAVLIGVTTYLLLKK